jgi:hypothetical protein
MKAELRPALRMYRLALSPPPPRWMQQELGRDENRRALQQSLQRNVA